MDLRKICELSQKAQNSVTLCSCHASFLAFFRVSSLYLFHFLLSFLPFAIRLEAIASGFPSFRFCHLSSAFRFCSGSLLETLPGALAPERFGSLTATVETGEAVVQPHADARTKRKLDSVTFVAPGSFLLCS